MGVIDLSAYKPVPSTLGDANQVANGFQALQNLLNGAVDNNNFAAGKIFDPLKIMQDGAIAGQALVWSAAANGGAGGWVPGNVSPGVYRKTTVKQVVNTVAETDLLNGEITVAAGAIGASGVLRLTAWGDWMNNSGPAQVMPRFKLKLGATTILDTNTTSTACFSSGGARYGWRCEVEIQNLGAANSQWSTLSIRGYHGNGSGSTVSGFATGEGVLGDILVAGGVGLSEALGAAAAAIDTSVAQALALTVINGVANAAYDVTLKGALVEIV